MSLSSWEVIRVAGLPFSGDADWFATQDIAGSAAGKFGLPMKVASGESVVAVKFLMQVFDDTGVLATGAPFLTCDIYEYVNGSPGEDTAVPAHMIEPGVSITLTQGEPEVVQMSAGAPFLGSGSFTARLSALNGFGPAGRVLILKKHITA